MAKRTQQLGVAEELRKLMHAAPFQPFLIRTAEGGTFTVDHPDFIMISPRGDMAVLYPLEEAGHHVLDLRHVVSMEPVRNGTKRSGRR